MKTFILGVGAQKCGTTWLYDQFKANKMVKMGFRKGYQFQTLLKILSSTIASMRNTFEMLQITREGQAWENLSNKIRDYAKHYLMLSLIDNVENYFNYFDYLYLKDGQTQIV